MNKVAIVGVEGSGKTVMLAGLGELYSRPDANGCFLSPKNYETANYVSDKIERMRRGEWPAATAGDALQGLDWTLKRKVGEGRRPEDVCEVSFLDFAGEAYRVAFGVSDNADLSEEADSLKRYIREADDVIVLINLSDIIVHGLSDPRVREAMWITNGILAYALDEKNSRKMPRAAIVLSQADSYADTIHSCGGVRGVLVKYLPHVANNYDWLDLLSASAVDRTEVNDEGRAVPAKDFKTTGLQPIMDWIVNDDVSAVGGSQETPRVSVCARPNQSDPEKIPEDLPAERLFQLGLACEMGDKCKQDYAKALAYYCAAADKGHAAACHNEGFMYEFGKGVPKDMDWALDCYREAVARGNDDAKAALERHGLFSDSPQRKPRQRKPQRAMSSQEMRTGEGRNKKRPERGARLRVLCKLLIYLFCGAIIAGMMKACSS